MAFVVFVLKLYLEKSFFKIVRSTMQSLGRVSLECSFHIWVSCNTREWALDGELPWKGFKQNQYLNKTPSESIPQPKPKSILKGACGNSNPKSAPGKSKSVVFTGKLKSKVPAIPANVEQRKITDNQLGKHNTPDGYTTLPWIYEPSGNTSRPVGIRNYGSTCYMNCILQAFLTVPECWKQYEKYRLHAPVLVDSFLHTLRKLHEEAIGKSSQPLSIPTLLNALGVVLKLKDAKAKWNTQQDVMEMMAYIVQETEKSLGPWARISPMCRKESTCLSCGSKTVDEVLDNHLILNLKETISQSLLAFLEEEFQNKSCPECQDQKPVSQRILFAGAPCTLFIQINRWKLESAGTGKSTLVKDMSCLDLENQNITIPVQDGASTMKTTMELRAVICHKGDTKSGHYFTYAKHGNDWYMLNDTQVLKLLPSQIAPSLNSIHAYVLVYSQQQRQMGHGE